MSEHTPYKGEVVGAIPTWTTKFNGDVVEWQTLQIQNLPEQSLGVQVPPSLPNFEKAVDIRRRCGKMNK